MQSRKALLSMGHIVTGLALYFASFDFAKHQLEPLDAKSLNENYLVRAKIIIEFNEFHDVTSRRCYLFRQAAMQHGEVPLPLNSMEEETNESENQVRKRGNTES